MYKQPKERHKLSIYEDIIFIWTLKKEEAALKITVPNNKYWKKCYRNSMKSPGENRND